MGITRLIIVQVAVQVISLEMFLTTPALQITIVAAIILLIAPVAGVPVAPLEAQVRQEVVAEALHP